MSGFGVDHGAYSNDYLYRNLDVPSMAVHAVGWEVRDSAIGDVLTKRHVFSGTVTFRDSAIDSFTIDNASNGGTMAANYVLINTGLSCSDIVVQSMVPGTTATVDGVSCSL